MTETPAPYRTSHNAALQALSTVFPIGSTVVCVVREQRTVRGGGHRTTMSVLGTLEGTPNATTVVGRRSVVIDVSSWVGTVTGHPAPRFATGETVRDTPMTHTQVVVGGYRNQHDAVEALVAELSEALHGRPGALRAYNV
jgi:hypothetical protein